MPVVRPAALALAWIGFATAAFSQQNIVFHDDSNAAVGVANAFPFGAIGVRSQQLVPGSLIGGPALIQDLFFAPSLDNNGIHNVSEVVYSDLEIRMGAFSGGTLTANWASNIPNPTIVYRGPLRVMFTRDQWSPLGLPNAYAWNPASSTDDLVIDITVWGVSNTGSVPPDANGFFLNLRVSAARLIQRAYRRTYTATQPLNAQNVDTGGVKVGLLLGDGSFVVHGNDCRGSNALSPQIGTPLGVRPRIGGQLAVTLANGPFSSIAVLYMGTSDRVWAGLPLPFDMSLLGAAGCMIWHDPQVQLAATGTDALGGGSLMFPIPNQANLMARRFYVSWFALDPAANALHVTTSGYATIITGS